MPDARLDALRQPGGDRILGPEAEGFFRADRLRLEGASVWPYAGDYAVGVVVSGQGITARVGSRLRQLRGRLIDPTTKRLTAARHPATITLRWMALGRGQLDEAVEYALATLA
jgi:hypothetical protein